MKKILFTAFIMATFMSGYAQENFGRTLNLGVGIGYYGYLYRSTPVLHANYEFQVAKNFTLAPFISYFSYTNEPYYYDKNRSYYYRTTIVPVGLKASYYFDDILNASDKWDFYLAGSIGASIRKTVWRDGYPDNRYDYTREVSPLYLSLHVGAEYHLNSNVGIFADFSTGVSTLGIAIHGN